MAVAVVTAHELGGRAGQLAGALFVDARGEERYAAGHIPGAIWLGWDRWSKPAPRDAAAVLRQPGYWGVQDDGPTIGERLSAAGIDGERPIVVYSSGPISRGREGRVAWMLLLLGAGSVSLLDGGWDAWVDAGLRVQREVPTPSPGRFTISLDERRRVTLPTLRAAWEDGRMPHLIDTRSRREFEGHEADYLPSRGHMPGAVLVPFASLFRANGRYVSRDDLLAIVLAETRSTTNRVAYCEVGVRASLFALLYEAYTGEIVSVYDGSLIEWGLEGLPVQTA